MLKIKLLFILLVSTKIVFAQFSRVVVGINGLTCSACSFATEKSIRELSFVDSVAMDLENNIATVFLKKDQKIVIDYVSKKFYDAGFSVRSLEAWFNFDNVSVTTNFCFDFDDDAYKFLNLDKARTLNGEIKLKFISEKYLSKNEIKVWKDNIKPINSCKSKSKNYFVTL